MVYCPYTDADIPKAESSSEHIIPLSLGGVNGFEVPASREFNSDVGSTIEGKLANDFLWQAPRMEFNARGRSGKEVIATVRHATYGEPRRPAQIQFRHQDGMRLWDARDRVYVRPSGSIEMNVSLHLDIPFRFLAKVAMGAGYFVYGDLYRQHVDHQQLRDIVRLDRSALKERLELHERKTGLWTVRWEDHLRLAPDDPDGRMPVFRLVCSSVKGSSVLLVPGEQCLGIFVGLLGRYSGMLNVPATTDAFPMEGDHDLGHAVSLVNGCVERSSLRARVKALMNLRA